MQRRSLTETVNAVYVSSTQKLGLDKLLAMIDARIGIDEIQHLRIRVPQSEGKLLAQIEARARILNRAYRNSAVQMEVEAPESLARVLRQFTVTPRAQK